MMRKLKRQLAVFMIMLVLTIPFYSSIVFGAYIESYSIYGKDGGNNSVSYKDDFFTIVATLSEEVTEDMMFVQYSKTDNFDSCIGNVCTYESSRKDRTPQEMEYAIQLVEMATVKSQEEGFLVIDGNEPDIEDYEVEVSDNDIEIEYEVLDTACDGCEDCAGVREVNIYQNENVIYNEDFSGECAVDEKIQTSVEELNLEDGDHEICVEAVDFVGQTSEQECELMHVDRTGPYFVTESLRVTEDGVDVEYIGDSSILARVKINVTDDDLDSLSVRGDFSGLNTVSPEGFEDMSGVCIEQEDKVYECEWNGVMIDDVSGSVQLKFSAKDVYENQMNYSTSHSITQDLEDPEVIGVFTDPELGIGEYVYLKEGKNTVYAQLDPTGSAFAKGEVYMDFSLGGLSNDRADDCYDDGGRWLCYWNVTVSNSATTTLMITKSTKDDAGNKLDEEFRQMVEVDVNLPVIDSIELSHVCPTSNDILEIYVDVTDTSEEVKIEMHSEDIRTDDDVLEDECVMVDDDMHECMIDVKDLVQFPESESVTIKVIDMAGNEAEDKKSISVCEAEDFGVPNFVSIYAEDAPPVDRRVMSISTYPLHVPVRFSVGGGAQILSKVAECVGASSVFFIDSTSTNSVMVVNLAGFSGMETVDEIEVECQVLMQMRKGQKVYMTPEEENVTLEIDMYNLPLGTYGEGVEDKLELLESGISKEQENIDKWVTWNTILGYICLLAESLGKLNSLIGVLRAIIHGVTLALDTAGETVAYLKPIAKGLDVGNKAVCGFGAVFDKIVNNYIWPPGLGFGSGQIGILKYLCVIYSGKLCLGYDSFIMSSAVKDSQGGGGGDGMGDVEDLQFNRYDPYKSIHAAGNCLFITGVIYNLRKKRQINCMRWNCISEHAEVGLPIETCDEQYSVRECLFYEGAAYKKSGPGYVLETFSNIIFNFILKNIDYWIEAIGYELMDCPSIHGWKPNTVMQGEKAEKVCTTDISDKGKAAPKLYMIACNIYGAMLVIQETGGFKSFFSWDTKNFKAELKGTDYCQGIGGGEE